jgi:hypothetical protein
LINGNQDFYYLPILPAHYYHETSSLFFKFTDALFYGTALTDPLPAESRNSWHDQKLLRRAELW